MAAFVSVVLSSLAGAAAPNVVADTRFNRERGFYDSGFAVVIQSRTAGARIRYTTDGSAPSPTHGLVWTTHNKISGGFQQLLQLDARKSTNLTTH